MEHPEGECRMAGEHHGRQNDEVRFNLNLILVNTYARIRTHYTNP